MEPIDPSARRAPTYLNKPFPGQLCRATITAVDAVIGSGQGSQQWIFRKQVLLLLVEAG